MGFPPIVFSDEATVDMIALLRLSVSRFGDGEYRLLEGRSIKSQKADPELQWRLAAILKGPTHQRHLTCILDLYSGKEVADVWRTREKVTARYGSEAWARKHLDPGRSYGCAGFTRLCHWALGSRADWWERVERIWTGRPVLLVTGSAKGLAAGTSGMLARAGRIETIDLQQGVDCWSRYPELEERLDHDLQSLPDDVVVLAALGPTATILAHDLARQGVQCIDIGHMPQSFMGQSPKEASSEP